MIPWYDSHWLNKYYLAKKWITLNRPEKLSDFDNSISQLRTDLTFKPIEIERVLSKHQLKKANSLINDIDKSKYEKHEILSFGRVVIHNDPFFLKIQSNLIDIVSTCLLYTSPSPRDKRQSRMPSSA